VLKQSSNTNNLTITSVEGSRIFFLVGGVAALTLLVNATLAQTVLYALGLVDDNSEEIRIMQHYARYSDTLESYVSAYVESTRAI